ncbi:MAG: hypothetical protein R6U98_10385, partial [Pirellulaceae bacterium]
SAPWPIPSRRYGVIEKATGDRVSRIQYGTPKAYDELHRVTSLETRIGTRPVCRTEKSPWTVGPLSIAAFPGSAFRYPYAAAWGAGTVVTPWPDWAA